MQSPLQRPLPTPPRDGGNASRSSRESSRPHVPPDPYQPPNDEIDDDDDFFQPNGDQASPLAPQHRQSRFEIDNDDYPERSPQQLRPPQQQQQFQRDSQYETAEEYPRDSQYTARESQYRPQSQYPTPPPNPPQTQYRESTYYDNNNQPMRAEDNFDQEDGFFGPPSRNYVDTPPPPPPSNLQPQHPQQQPVARRSTQHDPRRQPSPPSPPPLFDHSHLRPGASAALLSTEKTLEMYRINAKKTNDPEMQFQFAILLLEAIKGSPPPPPSTSGNPLEVLKAAETRENTIKDAVRMLQRLADRGHHEAQYFLADCFANGIGTPRNRQDFDRAYPLFVQAAKHGHADAAYRAGTCCENGWGCRREASKAVTFYRKAGALQHPGAMYRLGLIELNGELSQAKKPKEGVKWLKRSAEHATAEFPHALHELALLHERGIDNVLFVDLEYSAELLAQASELGYAPSAYRLGECYEYGKMGCPQDPALSIHYYNIAAQQEHRDACFALTAWYLVGSPGVLPQSDTEAFLWAKKAAERGLPKAMYAVGYFTEVGIGTVQSINEALQWYKKAAEAGDKRAAQRIRSNAGGGGPLPGAPLGDRSSPIDRRGGSDGHGMSGKQKDKDCVIM